MAVADANETPRFTLHGDQSIDAGTTMPAVLLTASGDTDGTGANNALVHTADANGSFVANIRFSAKGTNTASKAYIYVNNGSTNATASNNALRWQVTLWSTTASATAALADIEQVLNIKLKPGWRIYVGLGTTVAAGWVPSCEAEQY